MGDGSRQLRGRSSAKVRQLEIKKGPSCALCALAAPYLVRARLGAFQAPSVRARVGGCGVRIADFLALLISGGMPGCLRVIAAGCVFLAGVCCAQLPTDATTTPVKPDVIFVPTPKQIVDLMLLMAEVKKTGRRLRPWLWRWPSRYSRRETYGARGVGIDIDPALVAQARNMPRRRKWNTSSSSGRAICSRATSTTRLCSRSTCSMS